LRLVIPLFPQVTTLDAIGPYAVLALLPQAEVVFAAATSGPVTDDGGNAVLHAPAAFADVDGCDILVVPGGPGARALLTDEETLTFVRRMSATARWTTSVCTGALLLGAAGLLRGRRATTHWAQTHRLAEFGATHVPERVVADGTVVTAAGVSAGIDMALTLAARHTDRTTAEAIQLLLEYDPRPPFSAGSPASAPPAAHERLRAGLR
jgi:putative intracellular protease/amidase